MRAPLIAATMVCAAGFLTARPAAAWVQYCNGSNVAIYTTFSKSYDESDNCNGNGAQISGEVYEYDSWENTGWWYLTPGQCTTVSSIDMQTSVCYTPNGPAGCFRFYAQTGDGSEVWDDGDSGSQFTLETPAFDICDPWTVFEAGDSVPSPYYEVTSGLDVVGSYNNFTLTFN